MDKMVFTSHKGKRYQFPENCKNYFVKKLCKINNTEIIKDINVTFHKGKKISISKNYTYYFIKKLYEVKDCKNNSLVLDKKIVGHYNNTLEI